MSGDDELSLSIFDQTIFILENTNDGDDLTGHHLKLVESGVNGFLSEAGEVALMELYQSVKKGYSKPNFLGIENMTRDQEGFVYWKGVQVEHYDHDYWASEGWYDRMVKDAKELERRCKIIEDAGLKVNTSSVIWNWEKYCKDNGLLKELEF